jgi:hypothetical protein
VEDLLDRIQSLASNGWKLESGMLILSTSHISLYYKIAIFYEPSLLISLSTLFDLQIDQFI